MRLGFSNTCAIGLVFGLLAGSAQTALGQQTGQRHPTSTTRIPVGKDRRAAAAAAAERARQDSIAAVAMERARQDSIAAAERVRQQALASQDQRRREDSLAVAARQRQDSMAAASRAREDSIARAREVARARDESRSARRHNGGFYIGIAGGSTMPIGDIKDAVANSYDMGWNVTVPFGYDFGPIGLRFDVAMDNLTGKQNFFDSFGAAAAPRNVAIYSGSGGLKLNVPILHTPGRFYLMGGGGAHRITGYATSAAGSDSAQTIVNAKTQVGWFGGAGFNFRFGRSALFLESRYINIDTKQPPVGYAYQKTNYIPIILGFQF